MKLKKRKKVSRMHGHGMGSHGWGSRKKHVGTSGHRGGVGMSGTGKMAGHKKTLISKLYGGDGYFGKQGITSRKSERRKNLVINIKEIEKEIESLKRRFGKKDKTKNEDILDLSDYKILGDGEIKQKVIIKAKAASQNAIEKIEKAGGKIIIPEIKELEIKHKENAEHKENKEDKGNKESKEDKKENKKGKIEG